MGNFAENLNLGNRFRPPLHLSVVSGLVCFLQQIVYSIAYTWSVIFCTVELDMKNG